MQEIPERFRRWPGHVGNWHRWTDDRGALNLVTPQTVLRGIGAVRLGEVIACSRPVSAHDPIIPEPVFRHEMICAGRVPHWPERDVQNASDKMSGWVHGTANTHIDALAHIGFLGIGFNGHAHAEMVSMEDGVRRCDISAALGVVTRGVFVDVPAGRGVTHLAPGEAVMPNDIRDAAEYVEPGDAFVVRLGVTVAPGAVSADGHDVHGTWAGLHPECVDLLGRKGVAIIATDGPGDCYPSPLKGTCDSPVHVLSEVFWGIHLVHNMDLERLAASCRQHRRRDFLFIVTSLNVPRATGSLTTPVAVL